MTHALPRPVQTALFLFSAASLVLAPSAFAQNVVVNGDFTNGIDGWTIYDMGTDVSDFTPEVQLFEGPECPSSGSGQCIIINSTVNTYAGVLLWQEVQLVAGTPYTIEGQFKMLVDTVYNYWGQLYLSTQEPVDNVDYTPQADIHFGFNWWNDCPGIRVDGTFSENTCEGRLTPTFVPPGNPGEQVTYYFGFKTGVNAGPQTFAIALDDFRVEASQEAFAIAEFSTTNDGRPIVNEPATFDASASSASGTINSYAWDFGDGSTGSGAVLDHTYGDLGTFTVQLIVTSDDGAADTLSQDVTVWEGIGLPERPLEIPMAAAVPTIDGVMDAEWDGAQHVSVATHTNNDAPTGPGDLTVDAYLMWDAANFYVFFDVVDDSLHNDTGNTWEDDAPEFYLDGGNDKLFEAYDENDEAWELGWDNTSITGRGIGRAQDAQMFALTKDDGTGYTVEAMMPWSNIGVAPGLGDMIGFEAAINDDDSGGGRDTKLAWFSPSGNDNAYRWSHIWGNALLVDVLATAAEPEADLPGTFALEGIYPNPFNPSATAVLSVREPGDYTVRLFNVLGQRVDEREIQAQAPGQVRIPFDLAGRASGTYVVWIQHRATGRIVTGVATFVK